MNVFGGENHRDFVISPFSDCNNGSVIAKKYVIIMCTTDYPENRASWTCQRSHCGKANKKQSRKNSNCIPQFQLFPDRAEECPHVKAAIPPSL